MPIPRDPVVQREDGPPRGPVVERDDGMWAIGLADDAPGPFESRAMDRER
jgi:hypothetical protein